jgi:hypothetical protein
VVIDDRLGVVGCQVYSSGRSKVRQFLREEADAIRPANGDPARLLSSLDPAAAARVLGWVLTHRPDDGAELADAWVDEPAAAEIILSLDAGPLPKAGRKALRRVRHRLRSRGVEVAERGPEPMVSSLPPIEDELSGGFVTPIDPGGTRIAYLLESHPSGGGRLFEVVIDDRLGVVGCQVYSSGRSKVRQFLREGARPHHPSRRGPARRSIAAPRLLGLAGSPHERAGGCADPG